MRKINEIIYIFEGILYDDRTKIESPLDYILDLLSKDIEFKDLARNLNGQFNLLIIDFKKNEAVLISDRFALHPLYYFISEKRIVITTSMYLASRQLEHKLPDFKAFSHLLLYGNLVEGETYFSNIRRLKSGEILEININTTKIKIQKYFSFVFKKANKFAFNSFTEKLHKYWIDAIERRIADKSKIICQLSGGYDSRLNIATVDKIKNNKNITCCSETHTMVNPNLKDLKVANRVMKKLRNSFKRLIIHFCKKDKKRVIYDFKDLVRNICLHYTVLRGEILLAERLGNYNCPLLSGILIGELLGGQFCLNKVFTRAEDSFQYFLKYKASNNYKDNEKFINFTNMLSYKDLKDEYLTFLEKSENKTLKEKHFEMLAYIKGIGQRPDSLRVLSKKFEILLPIMDKNVIETILKGDINWICERKTHIEILRKINKRLANMRVDWAILPLNYPKILKKISKKFHSLLNIIKMRLMKNNFIRKKIFHLITYSDIIQEDEELWKYITKIISTPSAIEGKIFITEKIRKNIRQYIAGQNRNDSLFEAYLFIKMIDLVYFD
ncbi:MAG: hypothetical protein GF364_20775 [Candidatus Lokiarchaeota archaeon]|nr:hypothetical protein [Candidatus Lokiarchaeota archaeon]